MIHGVAPLFLRDASAIVIGIWKQRGAFDRMKPEGKGKRLVTPIDGRKVRGRLEVQQSSGRDDGETDDAESPATDAESPATDAESPESDAQSPVTDLEFPEQNIRVTRHKNGQLKIPEVDVDFKGMALHIEHLIKKGMLNLANFNQLFAVLEKGAEHSNKWTARERAGRLEPMYTPEPDYFNDYKHLPKRPRGAGSGSGRDYFLGKKAVISFVTLQLAAVKEDRLWRSKHPYWKNYGTKVCKYIDGKFVKGEVVPFNGRYPNPILANSDSLDGPALQLRITFLQFIGDLVLRIRYNGALVDDQYIDFHSLAWIQVQKSGKSRQQVYWEKRPGVDVIEDFMLRGYDIDFEDADTEYRKSRHYAWVCSQHRVLKPYPTPTLDAFTMPVWG
jgi:hypothetical protein